MGGYGSTRWTSHWKKDTVEECHVLSVFELKRDGLLKPDFHKWGSWQWVNRITEEVVASIGYEINTVSSWLRLHYTSTSFTGQKKSLDYRVNLQQTACNFGGVRWWFICPLTTNGRYCGRRVAKLYLPPSGEYFGCRHCHDLTYRSSQEQDKGLTDLKRLPPSVLLEAVTQGKISLPKALKALPDDLWNL